MVYRDTTIISDAVISSGVTLPLIAAGQGDGTTTVMTISAYVAGSLEIYLQGYGRLNASNAIITAAGNDYDYTETNPANGTITFRNPIYSPDQYFIYGTLA